MFQAVPLRPNLRIEVNLVIECFDTKLGIKIDQVLLELQSPKAAKLDVLERPI